MNILFFGDSITWGAWDKEGGWVARIKKFVDEKIIASDFEYYHDIYNVGISGDKTTDLLKRFDSEAKNRIDEDNETAIVFAIGVNDSQFVENEGNRTPIEKFKTSLESLIEKARKFSNKIIFIGLFPIDDSKLTPTSWEPTKSYKLEYVEEYDKVIKDVCAKEGIDFIDIYNEFIGKDYKNLLIDGLHPTTDGHKQISKVVLEFLSDKKYI
jgi:lysophospholipase L1-like esterase